MKFFYFLVLLSIVEISSVNPLLLDKIHNAVKWQLHEIGQEIIKRAYDSPCYRQNPENHTTTTYERTTKANLETPEIANRRFSKVAENCPSGYRGDGCGNCRKIHSNDPLIDAHFGGTTETNSTVPEVADRRVVKVPKNCPPGYKSDGHGNCREKY